MNSESSPPTAVRLPRRPLLAVGTVAVVTSLVVAGVWALGAAGPAAAAGGPGTRIGTVDAATTAGSSAGSSTGQPASSSGSFGTSTSSPTAVPPTGTLNSNRPPSSLTSYTWNFDDGTPQGWRGIAYDGVAPWVEPNRSAAFAGGGGLLVGGSGDYLSGVAVPVDLTLVRTGYYTVTGKVRMAPGQPGATILAPGAGTPVTAAGVTDAAWVDVTGKVAVREAAVTQVDFLIRPSACEAQFPGRFARGTSFLLDEVSLTRTGDLPTFTVTPVATMMSRAADSRVASTTMPPSPTPTCPGVATPAPGLQAVRHYEVTRVSATGFTANLLVTNLQDTAITSWTMPVDLPAGRRILWVAGADLVNQNGRTVLVGAARIPGEHSVRVSLGVSGSAIGTAGSFGPLVGIPTGWN